MQRLNRGMLNRYDIPERAPAGVRAVQFGLDETLLGVVDPLLDACEPPLGIAAVRTDDVPAEGCDPAEGRDPVALLNEQDGLYTVFVRGYLGEQSVNEERVVQGLLRAADAPEAVAEEPALALGILNAAAASPDAALASAARLCVARHRAGLGALDFVCVGEDADCAEAVRDALAGASAAYAPAPGFAAWLSACGFYPALADGLALRAGAKEAARLCAGMNYADGMIHLAEPGATLIIQAPEAFRRRWPLEGAAGVSFTDDLTPLVARKRRLFDAGLFAMAAPGWLLGCDTLADCMKHEALRAFVGRTYMEELLSADPDARAADAPYVVRAFERFENPLNDNAILRVAAPLLGRFRRSVLTLVRDWANARFEPPRCLSFALAATIMLYAGARRNDAGQYEVLRGRETHRLSDDAGALAVFATLAHDMPPETLAYAALADRELWDGADLRDIDGLEPRVALDIANLQRNPAYLPENELS